jgi:prepilin-type processing-associated H-X9-DG protein
MVVLGLVSLLASLVLPAVSAARESARRVRCAANLRQILLGVHEYQAAFGALPALCGAPEPVGDRRRYEQRQFSLFSRIVRDLDPPAFNAVNFSIPLNDFLNSHPESPIAAPTHRTVAELRIAVFLCPSAASNDVGQAGEVDYRANVGIDLRVDPHPRRAGPFAWDKSLPDAVITDGLSQTVAFGEKPHGRLTPSTLDPRTDYLNVNPAAGADEATDCGSFWRERDGFHGRVGLTWLVGSYAQTCYNHALTPNNPRPDCGRIGYDPVIGSFAARSNHPGGVQAAFADGSVRFFGNGVSASVWRSLATRSGGEIVPTQ